MLLGLVSALRIRRWVLRPTQQLQAGLRRVAGGDLEAVIEVAGPPEVTQVGRDAEAMRRRIVAELEEARGAREALEQRGPVVAGLRRELAPSAQLPVAGLDVAGSLQGD